VALSDYNVSTHKQQQTLISTLLVHKILQECSFWCPVYIIGCSLGS